MGYQNLHIGNNQTRTSLTCNSVAGRGYNKLIGLTGIIPVFEAGCQSEQEAAVYFEVTVGCLKGYNRLGDYIKWCLQVHEKKRWKLYK